VAGVFANLLFAWVLISLGFMTGLPAPLGLPFPVEDARTTITLVVPGSPADLVGLKSGDKLLSVDGAQLSPEEASEVISHSTRTLDFEIERGKSIRHVLIQPVSNFIPGRQAIGVSMELIGTAQLSPLRAVWEGAKITVELTIATAKALGGFILQALMGRADLSNVTGPVGLVGMVGDAQESGWGYLLSFTALISLNLAIINLLPFPALDGGRLLFVGIEALIRRPISPRVFNAMNTVGFALLIFLMILVTIHDVSNIF